MKNLFCFSIFFFQYKFSDAEFFTPGSTFPMTANQLEQAEIKYAKENGIEIES